MPLFTWRMRPTADKTLYLTFDDGPIPHVTNRVLELLAEHQAQATFFCIGHNAERYSQVLPRILRAGHQIGNHTQNHVNGWATSKSEYLSDVALGNKTLEKLLGESPQLFRPPFGRPGLRSIRQLTKNYHVIMWDVLSQDYRTDLSVDSVCQNVLKHVQNGSIVVFHDSAEAAPRMLPALERLLPELASQGYQFKSIG